MSDQSQFEIVGYFEDLTDAQTGKVYGTRKVPLQLGREFGVNGALTIELTQNTEIDRGHKKYVIKASPKKPVRVITHLNKLCGRMIRNCH